MTRWQSHKYVRKSDCNHLLHVVKKGVEVLVQRVAGRERGGVESHQHPAPTQDVPIGLVVQQSQLAQQLHVQLVTQLHIHTALCQNPDKKLLQCGGLVVCAAEIGLQPGPAPDRQPQVLDT